jgi:putative ABC transport system substrate-binding protein
MQRREFITLIGGVAVAWPLAARAQQPERMRLIGVLTGLAADDPDAQARYAAFVKGLQQLGWTDGRNVRIDTRWGWGDADNIRKHAAELAALLPDVILGSGSASVGSLLQATRTVPIVFVIVPDPVGSGFVDSLARPGGNATGFMQFEYSLSGKWLELLKQIAPGVTRAAVLRDPAITAGIGQFAIIQSVAPSLGLEVSPVSVRDATEIERAVAAFARISNGGLIVTASALSVVHREQIITLAARHKLPAVYFTRFFVTGGDLEQGLIDQDARQVNTKFSKSFATWFFPVGDRISQLVADWVNYLRREKLWGLDDPLFPATKIIVGANYHFEASGLDRKHWSSAGPIRKIFKNAFAAAELAYFNPHSFRKTLALLGGQVCKSPEEYKAWSQNLGHEHVLTTFSSYGDVGRHRQAEIIRALGNSGRRVGI